MSAEKSNSFSALIEAGSAVSYGYPPSVGSRVATLPMPGEGQSPGR